jgi:hypothetical protein
MKNTISLVLVLALSLIASVANADFTFGEPTNLGPIVNSSSIDAAPCISADGLSLYFFSLRPGGYGAWDIWVTTRDTTDEEWGPPVNLGPIVNSSAEDAGPHISADGLSLYFCSTRPGGYAGGDIWVTTRPTTHNPWGPPVNLGPSINSSSNWGPSISADGLSLFFHSLRPGGSGGRDLWVTTRATVSDPWGEPFNLGPLVNSEAEDRAPRLSADGLSLFFDSDRPGGYGLRDLCVSKRSTTNDPWEEPFNLGPIVNSSAEDAGPSISADGRTLYFCDYGTIHRPGGYGDDDLWQAPIIPIVDFNGDGIVDSADMCIMVDHWGTDEPLCDIGPTPLGEGIVDVQDLIILSEHLFEEVDDPTLVAHWALDETEGDIAYDSANGNDGTVYVDPAWLPEGGMVDGALQLDGIDDYVNTPFVLNPADGRFSVFSWVKGGAPGQFVISQTGGVNWLCADTLEGNLITELKATGRGAAALMSQTNITDGNWHRIGLVWDGSNRTLYVDGVAVAEDTQANLEASENGLYIGTGKDMEPGSFWSGLIDDVRIYNRAVTP